MAPHPTFAEAAPDRAPAEPAGTSEPLADPGFGRTFTPHVVVARYQASSGWGPLRTVTHDDVALGPTAMVLHYGQAIFEGLKAFRQPDGGVALFRPDANAERFDRSAERLAMPSLPAGAFVEACRRLVAADADLVPTAPGRALYLRPFMVASESALGVRPADEYLFLVVATPVGSYFDGATRPLRVWVSPDYVRAALGGTGAAKCSGNYAASLAAKQQALANGCDETLWVDAAERRWVEELGGMNLVAVTPEGTLVTPPPSGTILDGITRRCLSELGRGLGHPTVERPIALAELVDGHTFAEAFACGTAAVVTAIGEVEGPGGLHRIGTGRSGPVTERLRDALRAVQEGRAPDDHGWRQVVDTRPGRTG
jgi:branched-chain amino acid aminotransferase